MNTQIAYSKILYKYQLEEDFEYQLSFNAIGLAQEEVGNDFVSITKDGLLKIKRRYAWDGASGPTIDTKNTMMASLIHDAGYQLMREGLISRANKDLFDKELRLVMLLKGAMPLRADYYYLAVKRYGYPATIESKTILTA